ncbi:hypothetical protein GMOD_00001284 [Pyrenophora seminiperda CCB06]|uniref:Uncharacterized protein n=1 Tax=Pyrenophora seminiperda CCB06 TaxID=1302712 RepID=A0A3M7LYW5_9PLEO|nr:hypothetical protein GMOD_00001284 [Pyrenophora seminiperda CCB06]
MQPSVRSLNRHLGHSCQEPHHLVYGADTAKQHWPILSEANDWLGSNFRPGRSALAVGPALGLGLVGFIEH